MWRKCVTSTPMSDEANPNCSAALRAFRDSCVAARTVATTERCSGRPWLRASRSRSALAESTPISTWTSPSAPRSTSSMRCAEKSRSRRFRRPSESPSDAGTRCTAMSHSVCTLSSGASHPASTGWPGRRRSAWPHTMTSPTAAYFGYSYQMTFVSKPSVTALARSSPSRRAAVTPSAARRSVVCAHAVSSAAGVDATSATSTWRVWRFPPWICSVQWPYIAASRSGCGPPPAGASRAASLRTRTRSCIGLCSV